MNKFKVGDKVETRLFVGVWEVVEDTSGARNDYLYLCYKKDFNGHDGHNSSKKYVKTGEKYSTNEYWYFFESELSLHKEEYPEIHITTDGKTTTAQKILNGKVIKEESVTLYYKDTFDFSIGCTEALKKLNTTPHLKWKFNGDNVGEIGEPTEQTAIFGEKLYIGDVVEICNVNTGYIYNPCIVTRDKDCRGFIMGFGYMKFVNGISDCWQLRKVKSCKDLQNGEIIGSIEVVK